MYEHDWTVETIISGLVGSSTPDFGTRSALSCVSVSPESTRVPSPRPKIRGLTASRAKSAKMLPGNILRLTTKCPKHQNSQNLTARHQPPKGSNTPGLQQSSISACGQLPRARQRELGQVCAAREDCRRWRTSDPSLKPWPYCNPNPRYH